MGATSAPVSWDRRALAMKTTGVDGTRVTTPPRRRRVAGIKGAPAPVGRGHSDQAAGAGVLAVLQDAKALAVFALLAGFLAPIWLSTP